VSPMAISWVVFACVFGGALLGMLLRKVLPEHHLKEDSKDVVKLGMGVSGRTGCQRLYDDQNIG